MALDRCNFCQKAKRDVAYSQHYKMDLCRSCWEMMFDAMKRDDASKRRTVGRIWADLMQDYLNAAKRMFGIR